MYFISTVAKRIVIYGNKVIQELKENHWLLPITRLRTGLQKDRFNDLTLSKQ